MDSLQGQVKVINYMLIEEISQTFNVRFFLPYCKLYNIYTSKIVNFHFNEKVSQTSSKPCTNPENSVSGIVTFFFYGVTY